LISDRKPPWLSRRKPLQHPGRAGLASLAGINVRTNTADPRFRAILRSRRLVEEFVVRNDVLTALYPEGLPDGEKPKMASLFQTMSLSTITLASPMMAFSMRDRVTFAGGSIRAFVCSGMFHRVKEEKYPTRLQGFVAKQVMLLTAMWSYIRYWAARRVRAVRKRPPRPT
jgi:hypothetical protein